LHLNCLPMPRHPAHLSSQCPPSSFHVSVASSSSSTLAAFSLYHAPTAFVVPLAGLGSRLWEEEEGGRRRRSQP
jgi:hypothetical protein